MDYIAITTDNYLEHHGILGQKWGIRRYQNADGSLTEAGKKRQKIKDEDKQDIKDVAKSSAKLGAAAALAGSFKALLPHALAQANVDNLAQLPIGILREAGWAATYDAPYLASILVGSAGLGALPVSALALGVAGTAGLVGTGAAMVKRYFKRHSESKNE